MESICDFSLSVRPSIDWMPSNLFMYFFWSSRILQSELVMIASFTMGDEMMSSTSCVTTIASPKYFLTVLYMYFKYSVILGEERAFQASSQISIFRTPFRRRSLLMKASMMMIVTTGNSSALSFILSISNTMNRLCSRSMFSFEFSRKS